jgi:hypothetical protein
VFAHKVNVHGKSSKKQGTKLKPALSARQVNPKNQFQNIIKTKKPYWILILQPCDLFDFAVFP